MSTPEYMDRLGLTHQGASFHRTSDDIGRINPERVFAERWAAEQNPEAGTNYGIGVLAWLVTSQWKDVWSGGKCLIPNPKDLTQRDAMIAASVIQWLGTNVGWCFLEEVLEECGYVLTRKKEKS